MAVGVPERYQENIFATVIEDDDEIRRNVNRFTELIQRMSEIQKEVDDLNQPEIQLGLFTGAAWSMEISAERATELQLVLPTQRAGDKSVHVLHLTHNPFARTDSSYSPLTAEYGTSTERSRRGVGYSLTESQFDRATEHHKKTEQEITMWEPLIVGDYPVILIKDGDTRLVALRLTEADVTGFGRNRVDGHSVIEFKNHLIQSVIKKMQEQGISERVQSEFLKDDTKLWKFVLKCFAAHDFSPKHSAAFAEFQPFMPYADRSDPYLALGQERLSQGGETISPKEYEVTISSFDREAKKVLIDDNPRNAHWEHSGFGDVQHGLVEMSLQSGEKIKVFLIKPRDQEQVQQGMKLAVTVEGSTVQRVDIFEEQFRNDFLEATNSNSSRAEMNQLYEDTDGNKLSTGAGSIEANYYSGKTFVRIVTDEGNKILKIQRRMVNNAVEFTLSPELVMSAEFIDDLDEVVSGQSPSRKLGEKVVALLKQSSEKHIQGIDKSQKDWKKGDQSALDQTLFSEKLSLIAMNPVALNSVKLFLNAFQGKIETSLYAETANTLKKIGELSSQKPKVLEISDEDLEARLTVGLNTRPSVGGRSTKENEALSDLQRSVDRKDGEKNTILEHEAQLIEIMAAGSESEAERIFVRWWKSDLQRALFPFEKKRLGSRLEILKAAKVWKKIMLSAYREVHGKERDTGGIKVRMERLRKRKQKTVGFGRVPFEDSGVNFEGDDFPDQLKQAALDAHHAEFGIDQSRIHDA